MANKIRGVSPEIDSCSGMINKAAIAAHRRIGPANRRWLDEEDLVQDAVLMAVTQVQPVYRVGGGNKFSTHLYTALGWHFSKFCTGLAWQKRDAILLELDRPMPSGGITQGELLPELDEGVGSFSPGGRLALLPYERNCIQSFVSLCRAVSEEAVAVLVRGFLFSSTRGSTPALCAEIGIVASKLQISINDLRPLGQDEELRKKVLIAVSKNVMIGVGTEYGLRCLECTGCTGSFNLADVREGRFYVEVMTCRACLQKLKVTSCFGKAKTKGAEGYSANDTECVMHCQDRRVCKDFKENTAMTDKDVDDVDFSDVEEKAVEVSKKKKAAAKPVAKGKGKGAKEEKATSKAKSKVAKEKKPKQEKEPDEVPPKGVVEWPTKRGSGMRWLFKECLAGTSKKKTEEFLKANGYNVKNMMRWVARPIHAKHTWTLVIDGDKMQITSVKFTGEKAAVKEKVAPAAAKPDKSEKKASKKASE